MLLNRNCVRKEDYDHDDNVAGTNAERIQVVINNKEITKLSVI